MTPASVTNAVLMAEDIRWSTVEPAPASAAIAAAAKSVLCRAIAPYPVRWWPRLSAIVRRIWCGLRHA